MTVLLEALCTDAADPQALARFWAGVIGGQVAHDRPGAVTLVPEDPRCVPLRFRHSDAPRTGPNRYHLHVTTTSAEDMAATVAHVLELGGEHLDVGQTPQEGHVVLADPDGTELSVHPAR
ncbi:VOC family protein [Phycicoccus endophyticus]|uniref:VOC family protein n=1 Tax=Phycicoccus endophyticus TaxID=1690220 RepID=A0A7G9QYT8_9MICO|nr:VOC family protein [Phycicoccus endophyticus]NHI20442.1 VOC family protein [Phycicoccus endophyticus]QNN48513.1 VOC family protein [Phycicoccus endophyticus]GGL30721.1 hypothetical protein GCM10012283_11380 [Phycicoccus endophyticus]